MVRGFYLFCVYVWSEKRPSLRRCQRSVVQENQAAHAKSCSSILICEVEFERSLVSGRVHALRRGSCMRDRNPGLRLEVDVKSCFFIEVTAEAFRIWSVRVIAYSFLQVTKGGVPILIPCVTHETLALVFGPDQRSYATQYHRVCRGPGRPRSAPVSGNGVEVWIRDRF